MSTRIGSALALAVGLAACGDDSSTVVVSDDPVADAVDDGQAQGVALANQIAAEFAIDDQPTIIAQTGSMLRAINDGEIDTSGFAVQVLRDEDTFELANDMIIAHDNANVLLDGVMRIYGVGFLPTQAEATLRASVSAEIQALRATPIEDIDFAYAELQVRMHAQAQVIVDQLDSMVEAGPMIQHLQDTRLMVGDHLARAEDLLATFF